MDHDRKGRTVLAVDDYVDLRQMVARMLLRSGYSKVVQAESGEQCLELVKNSGFDIILLDISMPGISGIDTCKNLRSMTHTKQTRIVACTAHANAKHSSVFIEAGFNDILYKPFGYAELMAKLDPAPEKEA